MNRTISINPSISFFRNYENNILKTRESLFAELDGISSHFGNEARKILNEKLQSNNNTPLLGELFPWIIKDLINANTEITHKISVGWLAMYLYTLFLDEQVDNPKPLKATKLITGSLLAKTGLLKISRFTYDTPYEKLIDEALSFSAKNQQLDSEFQQENTENSFKENYSKGKNYIVLVCAGALAAENSEYGDFITKFTKNLLLSLQYLDDITDFKEDFALNNFTVLLNDAFKENPEFNSLSKNYSNNELLSELISSGALLRVVEKIVILLNQSILLIKQNKAIDIKVSKYSFEFFITLNTNCILLSNYLKNNSEDFKTLSKEKQFIILNRVNKYVALIAQSS